MRNRLLALALVTGSCALALGLALVGGGGPGPANAASHREAPLISLDPAADITDFFMFRSYEPGNADKVVFVMDVIPGEEPSSGPNYYNFDPNVRYSFGIDNNRDGRADDIRIDVQFKNEIRGVTDALGLPLSFTGGLPPANGSVIPPITSLDSAGLGLRQKYSVTVTKSHGPNRRTVLGDNLIAVPSNVGPRTMPNYQALVDQGTYGLGNGVKVFAGQRQDPFYIDLGAVFDSLNLRKIPPVVDETMPNVNQFGTDMLAGFNVHTIAIELPASLLTSDGKGIAETSNPVLGAYAFTSRPKVTIRSNSGKANGSGPFVEVQRLANPLVNELIIGTKDKDRWNATTPDDEAQFLGYYLKPRVSAALELAFGFPTGCILPVAGCQPTPPAPVSLSPPLSNFNRTDLAAIFLKYDAMDPGYSELLRLNLTTAPTPLAQQNRLGAALSGDGAGWPNGRRPRDDVTDIAVRAAGGPVYAGANAGDGVNVDDAPLSASFPFLANPADGRNYNVPGDGHTPHPDPGA
jgi:hypothetical protein